eukprot:199091-Chlamydomonas_euryale.AAC.3
MSGVGRCCLQPAPPSARWHSCGLAQSWNGWERPRERHSNVQFRHPTQGQCMALHMRMRMADCQHSCVRCLSKRSHALPVAMFACAASSNTRHAMRVQMLARTACPCTCMCCLPQRLHALLVQALACIARVNACMRCISKCLHALPVPALGWQQACLPAGEDAHVHAHKQTNS